MVGDSAKDDIAAGNNAGCHTILLDYQQQQGGAGQAMVRWRALGQALEGVNRPTHIASSLDEVRMLLEEHFEVVGSPPAALSQEVAI